MTTGFDPHAHDAPDPPLPRWQYAAAFLLIPLAWVVVWFFDARQQRAER